MAEDTDNVIIFNPRDRDLSDRRDELLMGRRRIRRTAELPRSLEHDLATGVRYPLRLKSAPAGYEVRYRRTRWYDILGNDDGPVWLRETVAWIYFEGEAVGAVEYSEYRFDLGCSNEEVFYVLDGHSTESARLGDLITLMWPNLWEEVVCWGDVVELERIWQSPRHLRPGLAFEVAQLLLRRARREASLFVVHLFPEEYNWRAPPSAPSRVGFDRRLAAMKRVASRRLELEAFPGKAGNAGWFYATNLSCPIPAPVIREEPKTTLLW